jgi:hypothetical protein
MNNIEENKSLIPKPNYALEIQNFETALLEFIESKGLPSQSVLVTVKERGVVFGNIDNVLEKIDEQGKTRSIYLSKFLAASASGLFDAALNYLWDETINELRRRVAQYDLPYFYDIAVNNPDRRKKLDAEDDLIKLEDSELIQGANKIGLISDLGFKHLDFIKYMRNWASAAHPNQNQITGLQLVSWLETCIVEVISLPLTHVLIEIKKLLANIKENKIDNLEGKQISSFFANLTQDQVSNLAAGFFGIYTQPDTTSQTRQNVHLLLPPLWTRVDESMRHQFGVKYAKFLANNDQLRQKLARQFLELVEGISYIPDGIRSAEIETAIQDLLAAHRESSNFYNEPAFARQLQRIVGETGNVPLQVQESYVIGLVEVFLTNGNGIAWNAEPIYLSLLDKLDPNQALTAILSFDNIRISSRLQFQLCQQKFRQLLDNMKTKVSAPAVKELIAELEIYTGPLDKMKDDSRVKRKVDNLKRILSV